jgi:hypothetical protein
MRTSHKAKDAAAEKQSYVCDTFTGHGNPMARERAGTGHLTAGMGTSHRPHSRGRCIRNRATRLHVNEGELNEGELGSEQRSV